MNWACKAGEEKEVGVVADGAIFDSFLGFSSNLNP